MISIISLLLDLLCNTFINRNSLFLPLFTLLSIIFIKKDDKYYLKVGLLGFIYDIIFTNFYILNSFLFLIMGFIIFNYYKKYKYSIFSNIILSIIIIIIYNI